MPTRAARRLTLLGRWTYRYVLTLFVGLLAIGIASAIWLRHDTVGERKQSLRDFSVAAADYVVGDDGAIRIPADFYEWIDRTQRQYHLPGQFALYVFEPDGRLAFFKSGPAGATDGTSGEGAAGGGSSASPAAPSAPPAPSLPTAPPPSEHPSASRTGDAYALAVPLKHGEVPAGSLLIVYGYGELARVDLNYTLIVSLLLCAGALGWTIIFLLSRHLRKPIYRLREALQQVEAGNYKIDVPTDIKEKELHELLVSFRGMAARLGRLEELRTELLAGVTHELKTPVASIRGLVSAVRDEVVTGDEAKEFLDISLEQTLKLQRMVGDLLDFNAFASGSIDVRGDDLDLGRLLGEVVYQWELLDEEGGLTIATDFPEESGQIAGDAARIQQIVVNLLNNASQAMGGSGSIRISMRPMPEPWYEVIVEDDGPGIPETEQGLIFERYYRGKDKKTSVSGLGLGLTYSRMLAAAMGGSLSLLRSSPQGTAFRLLLPRKES